MVLLLELKTEEIFPGCLLSIVLLSVNFSNFIVFSITTRPISTRLATQHPLVKGIQVCSNERSHPIPRGDNNQIIKLHWQHLKIFFSQNHV